MGTIVDTSKVCLVIMENGAATGDKGDEDERKVFIGGLSMETTDNDMRTYFEKFGTIEKCILKIDQMTGYSRGFGFIVFEDAASVEAVMAETSHEINNKKIGPRRAKPRPKPDPILKVFVGGLDPSVPEETIKSYFEQYGAVEEINLPMDRTTNERKNFCFVKFESEEIVNQVLANNNAEGKQTVGEKEVDIKKHTPKDQFGGRGGRGGRGFGGRGRGRGGFMPYGGYDPYGYGGYPGYGGYDYTQGYGGGFGKAPRARGRGQNRGRGAPY